MDTIVTADHRYLASEIVANNNTAVLVEIVATLLAKAERAEDKS